MYEHDDSAAAAGVAIIPDTPGLLYPCVGEKERNEMQEQARSVQRHLQEFYAAPALGTIGPLKLAIEHLAKLAYTCADDTALYVIEDVDVFGGHLEDLTLGRATTLVLPPLEKLEKALQNIIDNVIKLETSAERHERQRSGLLTSDEWQCEQDTRELHRALDAEYDANILADYYAER